MPEVPRSRGFIRKTNDHFRVDEILGFDPAGDGEHLYIQIRKNGQNTGWVKEQLARQLGVKTVDIGHSGLKDRHAITTQWLSIYLPTRQPSLNDIEIDGVEVLQARRHGQKLRPGTHKANQFSLMVTDVERPEGLQPLLELIKLKGFPNFFGEQRFGRQGNNLKHGWELLKKRKLRHHKNKSIYLSALRAYLFNQVLNERIDNMLESDENLDSTGPLWGRGRPAVGETQKKFELDTLKSWQPLCEALEFSGLKNERRQLYQTVWELDWSWPKDTELKLDFSLPPGSFATALLYELLDWVETDKAS